ncbi:hypothetical protein VTJ04DRAFT_1740 [Mycothermus thermophilus]|uniref:uncharacterized protein n=1 Tax=Humicola insolens TaxID=85995 RepID=UPI0037444283
MTTSRNWPVIGVGLGKDEQGGLSWLFFFSSEACRCARAAPPKRPIFIWGLMIGGHKTHDATTLRFRSCLPRFGWGLTVGEAQAPDGRMSEWLEHTGTSGTRS